jgi:pimeloyl-ACP methyl ester carboxylesterase
MSTVWSDLVGAEVKFYEGKYQTRVIEMGQGEPFILIHGLNGHAETWSRVMPGLAEHFRCIAIDLVYHGFSQKEPRDGKLFDHYMAQVIDVMDVIGAQKAHVEGESMGGWTAMLLALKHPDRLNKIILDTAAGIDFDPQAVQHDPNNDDARIGAAGTAAVETPTRETVRGYMESLVLHPEVITDELTEIRCKLYSDPDINDAAKYVRATLRSGAGTQYRLSEEEVSKISVPTLVLWSDHNPREGEDAGERLASLIKGAEYHCVRDAGHWPEWEVPDQHNAAVLSFLASHADVRG